MALLKKIYVLGGASRAKLSTSVGRVVQLRSGVAIHKAVRDAATTSVKRVPLAWIALDSTSADSLLEVAITRTMDIGSRRRRLGDLILLDAPRLGTIASARGVFSTVAWTDNRQHWLSLPELTEIINDPKAKDYIIGGMVDVPTRCLTLYRGNFTQIVVPLSIFKPTGEGTLPDPSDFEVIDCGQAIRLGDYEAVAGSIFYEADPDYRRRWLAERREQKKGFGPSFRRLRIQLGLRQSDFSPLTQKTIARIENGDVQKPQGKTLRVIANRLGVEPTTIETY